MPVKSSTAELVVTALEVRTLAAGLLTDELAVLPVRHHSPACAWQVRRAIRDLQPSAVLVEGPRGFDPLIPLLTHPRARMPLAIYTYAARRKPASQPDERRSAFYPFCDYSPELVALREGTKRGLPCRFIDLDFAEQCPAEESQEPDADDVSLLDERHYRHSEGLQLLANRLGCRDHEDLWERLFESDPDIVPLAEHVARVAAYSELARRDQSTPELDSDGTSAREAEMVWHIREALDRREPGSGPVLVVVGGFHAVALPDLLAEPPARPTLSVKGLDTDAVVIRYTFERLERLNGYAAGMTSPAWHQMLWQAMLHPVVGEHPRATATLTALLDITRELRTRHKMPVPVPSVTAAFGQALQLAALRDRPAPLRSDLVDAVTSCFVKGDVDVDGVLIRAAVRRALTGNAVGRIPPGAGTPPLVTDAQVRLRRQRLRLEADHRQTASLDIYRRPVHRTTSRLLHGLAVLSVPFAKRTAGPDFVTGSGMGRLQEKWEYLWTPATEGALVEASVLGSTVPAAVKARFRSLLDAYLDKPAASGASGAVALLVQACVLGLHGEARRALRFVRDGIGSDASFPAVAEAAAQLSLLWEAREPLEARQLQELPALLDAVYQRAVFLGGGLGGSQADPVGAARALVGLRELLVSEAGTDLDADLYWQLCEDLATHHEAPVVRGAATGLRYSGGRMSPAELSNMVHGHLSGTLEPETAVGFLVGLLMTARESAWQEPEILACIDRQLSAWDARTFVAHLPELRLAFAGMTPVETDRIAQAVASLHGSEALGPLHHRDIGEVEVHHNLEISEAVREILARDGLASWGGPS